MKSANKRVDSVLFWTVVALIFYGLIIFFSASLGLLARDGAKFGYVTSNQIGLGIILGGLCSFIVSNINYKKWGKYSFFILLFAIIITFLVWIPGLGFKHGGATRWISIGSLTFQPAEFLKIAYIIYLSAWISNIKTGIKTTSLGLYPFLIISSISVFTLIIQPDIGTTLLMLTTGSAIYFISGANLKHIFIVIILGIFVLFTLVLIKPYLKDRLTTFLNPNKDSQGSGWQIQQSLIAIGSGKIKGRGFGQSIQKYNYLPEPIGDSIFAVAGEEFGFIGASILIILFCILFIRGIQLSIKSKDTFGALLIFGLIFIIVAQSFFNIGAMLGIMPLSGLPLIFVSHGGTAMFFSLFSIGIIMNISRHIQKS